MHRGYIKLWRSSVDSKLYFAEPFTKWQAWVDLLLLANHKTKTVMVRGIPVVIERGQVMGSERFLADRWKWSRGKVQRFMSYLTSKPIHQIVPQKNNVATIISIVNFEHYQMGSTTDSTAERATSSTTDGPQTGHKQYQPKNVKNEENDNNDKNTRVKKFSPPTLEQVVEYCKERKNSVTPEKWHSHYTSNGWLVGRNKMKDWQAAVRTWENNNGGNDGRRLQGNRGQPGASALSTGIYHDTDGNVIERV